MPDRSQSLRETTSEYLARGPVGPFSAAGFEQLRRCIEEYIDALTGEALRVAKRAQADTISSAHVDDASRHLLALRGRRVFRHLGTIGGILLGTGIAQVVSMISDAKITAPGVAISVAFGIVGAFLVALHIAKE
jgi:histone H3/H4